MTTDSDASSIPHPEKKRPKPRQIVWMILAVMFIISLVLSVLSAGNYTEIAKASALTHVVTTDSAVIGLDENGNP
ncbi:MAG: hypothetical protein KJ773_05865, partial [Candidatus Thermoplasmatota archaeon]|nr:hypothetical protein [Candidatus Thermoplasmatota archaeon]